MGGANKSNRLFHLSNSLPLPSGQRSELARTAVQSAEHHSADAVVGPPSHHPPGRRPISSIEILNDPPFLVWSCGSRYYC